MLQRFLSSVPDEAGQGFSLLALHAKAAVLFEKASILSEQCKAGKYNLIACAFSTACVMRRQGAVLVRTSARLAQKQMPQIKEKKKRVDIC